MFRILATLTLSTALAFPALAEGMGGDMACKSFNALDHDGMMAAMEAAKMAPDAMAKDAMAPDAMAKDGMAKDAMAPEGAMKAPSDAMGSGDAMASEGGMMGKDDALAGLIKACADHPEKMVHDAMMPMK